MNCSIVRNKGTNKIEQVLDPLGNDSILYKDLLDEVQNEEEAVDLVMLSRTDEFRKYQGKEDWMLKEQIIEPSAKEVLDFDKANEFVRKAYQFDTGVQNELAQTKTFLKKTIKDLTSKLDLYRGKEKAKDIEDYLNRIKLDKNVDEYNKAETLNALVAALEYNAVEIPLLEEKLRERSNIDYNKLTGEEAEQQEQRLLSYLMGLDLFLQGYSRIQQLDSTDFANVKEIGEEKISKIEEYENEIRKTIENKGTELSPIEVDTKVRQLLQDFAEDNINNKIKLIVNIMKQYQPRIEQMRNKHKQLYEEHATRVVPRYTTNPQLLKDATKFLAEQYDEAYLQYILDGMGDTHNPFVANLIKLYTVNEFKKEQDIKDTNEKFLDTWLKFKKEYGDKVNDKFMQLIEHIDGKPTGALVKQYDDKFYDEYYLRRNKIEDLKNRYGDTDDTYLLEKERYNEWLRNNTVQEVTQEVIDMKNLLTLEARVARNKLYRERDEILKPYKKKSADTGDEYYNNVIVSKEDMDKVIILNSKLKKLAETEEYVNGKWVQKTGQDLAIAQSIQAYNKRIGELDIYETKVIPEFYDDFAKGGNEFRDYNTYDRVTDEYYKALETVEKTELPDSVRGWFDEIKKLTKPYKDYNDVYVDYIPTDILDRINELEDLVQSWFESADAKEWFANTGRSKKPSELESVTILTDYFNRVNRKVEQNENGYVIITLNDGLHPLYNFRRPAVTINDENNIRYVEPQTPRDNYTYTILKEQYKNKAETRTKDDKLIPTDKWLNEDYLKIRDDKTLSEFYDYFKDLLINLVGHYEGGIVNNGYLPAIENKDVSNWEVLINAMGAYKRDTSDTVNVDMKDNIIRYIPLNFVKYVGERKDVYVLPRYNKESETYSEYEERVLKDFNIKNPDIVVENILDIKNHINKVKQENKLIHGAAINYDLEQIMPLFIKSALNHKYKSKIQNELLLGREYLANESKIIKVKGRSTPIKVYNRFNEEKENYTVSGNESNTLKHFDKWLDMVFYENFEKDEGMLTTVARVLQNYTSLRGIGFNPFSGLNNVIYGKLQMALEAGAKYYFSASDWKNAAKDYATHTINYLRDKDAKDGEYTSLESALIKEWNIMESQDEKAESTGIATSHKKIHKILMATNAVYILQHLGEHNMQNQTLFAMMRSHRIVNGKALSFAQYREGVLEKTDLKKSKEENQTIIKRNEERETAIKTQFESYPTVRDAVSLKDGKLIRNKELLSDETLALFIDNVIAVNQKLHGIYNKKDAGTLQHFALGRLVIQFRKWIPEGVNKRYYGVGRKNKDRVDWNERRSEEKEGMYVSTFKLLTMPFKDAKTDNNTYKEAVKNVLSDLSKFSWKNNIYWYTLSETQKANVKRTFVEFAEVAIVLIVFGLAKALDDDDEDRSIAYNALIYQLSRTKTELRTYTPFGVINEAKKIMKSPTATFSVIEQIIKLGSIALQYPFWDGEERKYQTGSYHGKDKLFVNLIKGVPIANQVQRAINLQNEVQYYKLY